MQKVKERKINYAIRTFGERLRDQREALGLSRHNVADQIGMTHIAIRSIENGLSVPSFETVLRLAVALNLPLDPYRRIAS